jgi:hypothetical protein
MIIKELHHFVVSLGPIKAITFVSFITLIWKSFSNKVPVKVNYIFYSRLVLSQEQVSLYIVHLGGLSIDLVSGFLLLFDKTRPIAFVSLGMFHLMNSQLFSIGRFAEENVQPYLLKFL